MTRLDRLVEALAPPRRLRIADVGANPVMTPPYADLLAAGGADVWGFEPDPEAFAELEKAKGSNETYLPYAVGDGRVGKLHVCQAGPFTSLLAPDPAAQDYLGQWHYMMHVVDRRTVRTRRLDDMDELPRVDLLKIDVQGAEIAVFMGARDRLSEAVAVITETAFIPLYRDQPLLDEQMRVLRGFGFILHKFLHVTSRPLKGAMSQGLQAQSHGNQMIDGDAVFIRDLRHPDALSNAQLCNLAILADSVFSSFDLTLRCLELLIARGAVAEPAARGYLEQVPGRKWNGRAHARAVRQNP